MADWREMADKCSPAAPWPVRWFREHVWDGKWGFRWYVPIQMDYMWLTMTTALQSGGYQGTIHEFLASDNAGADEWPAG